ncbi:MAG: substrate binding domain-containing protein, partial [Bdellovibrionota bacterium]
LGSISFAPFASPKYLKTAGTPESPKDLKQHHFVRFTPLLEHEWRLRKEGDGRASTTIAPDGPIIVNDLNTMKTLAASGNGIAMLPGFFCYPEIKSGKLVRLLPGWHAEQNPVHFVYPGQKHVSSKLSAFIAFATEPIRRSLGGN